MNTPKAAPVAVEAVTQKRVDYLLANPAELVKFVKMAQDNADDYLELNRRFAELASPLGVEVTDAVERGWSAALRCHALHGASGWSAYRDEYMLAATRPQEVVRAEPDRIPRLFDKPQKAHYQQCKDCALAYQNMADDCGWMCDGKSASESKRGMFIQRTAPAGPVPLSAQKQDQGDLAVAESDPVQGVTARDAARSASDISTSSGGSMQCDCPVCKDAASHTPVAAEQGRDEAPSKFSDVVSDGGMDPRDRVTQAPSNAVPVAVGVEPITNEGFPSSFLSNAPRSITGATPPAAGGSVGASREQDSFHAANAESGSVQGVAVLCDRCNGSGEIAVMTHGHGPDDYEVPTNCPKCAGLGVPTLLPSRGVQKGDPSEPRDDSDRLAPCPFCGSEAEGGTMQAEPESIDSGAMFVQCTNPRCMASSALIYPLGDDPKPLLLERWNRRAQYRDDNYWRGWNAAIKAACGTPEAS